MTPIQIKDLHWRQQKDIPPIVVSEAADWLDVYHTLRFLAYQSGSPVFIFDSTGGFVMGLAHCGGSDVIPAKSGHVYIVDIPAPIAAFCRVADQLQKDLEIWRDVGGEPEPPAKGERPPGCRCECHVPF